jgi:hypothetical protein
MRYIGLVPADSKPEPRAPIPEVLPPEPREPEVGLSVATKFRAALVLALLADAIELAIIPLFVEGAESPLADAVDIVMAAAFYFLLGWHWEFLPSFAGKLIPGVDLVPLWTLAVANVYRKSRRDAPPTDPRP